VSHQTDQLIRDYLGRLTFAARGRLAAEDRRALVARTREFIEQRTDVSGPADPMQVAALLSRLGDPGVLVDHEVARLSELRGEPPVPPSELAARLYDLRRRRQGQASWHWPRAQGSLDLQRRLLHDSGSDAVATTRNSGSAPPIWIPPQPSGPGTAGDGTEAPERPPAGSAAAPSVPPAPVRGSPAGAAESADTAPQEPIELEPPTVPVRPVWPSVVARTASTRAFDPAAQRAAAPPDDVAAARPGAGGAAAGLALVLGRARRSPVEAAAIILLGLGGAIYPPVWLLGAALALAHPSKVWDYRDKWAGVAAPALLLVVGTALAVTLGSHYKHMGGYVHEGWLYADVLSRVLALLGACYLLWRLVHGRPRPPVPPWNRPHKVD
jgi:hypothetical protein